MHEPVLPTVFPCNPPESPLRLLACLITWFTPNVTRPRPVSAAAHVRAITCEGLENSCPYNLYCSSGSCHGATCAACPTVLYAFINSALLQPFPFNSWFAFACARCIDAQGTLVASNSDLRYVLVWGLLVIMASLLAFLGMVLVAVSIGDIYVQVCIWLAEMCVVLTARYVHRSATQLMYTILLLTCRTCTASIRNLGRLSAHCSRMCTYLRCVFHSKHNTLHFKYEAAKLCIIPCCP